MHLCDSGKSTGQNGYFGSVSQKGVTKGRHSLPSIKRFAERSSRIRVLLANELGLNVAAKIVYRE